MDFGKERVSNSGHTFAMPQLRTLSAVPTPIGRCQRVTVLAAPNRPLHTAKPTPGYRTTDAHRFGRCRQCQGTELKIQRMGPAQPAEAREAAVGA